MAKSERLVKKFGKKRAGELLEAIETAETQPEDMDVQGGSDENSPYERFWKVKGA